MIHIHKSFPRQMHRSSAVTRLVFTFWVQLTSFHSMTNHRILNTKTNPKQWFLAALHRWPASMCSFNFRGSKCSILHTMETCFLTAASASPAPMLGINFCWFSAPFDHCDGVINKNFLQVEFHENYTAQNMLYGHFARVSYLQNTVSKNPRNTQCSNRTEFDCIYDKWGDFRLPVM